MEEIWKTLINEAASKLNERTVSNYVTCGQVSAAIETVDGNIYTGVCVDASSSLGICAERNAIFNMLTNGESKIKRIVAINIDKIPIPPCGACRELIVQLSPKEYQDIEILINNKVYKFKELTPEWWIK